MLVKGGENPFAALRSALGASVTVERYLQVVLGSSEYAERQHQDM
jgi:hypothetical protein